MRLQCSFIISDVHHIPQLTLKIRNSLGYRCTVFLYTGKAVRLT